MDRRNFLAQTSAVLCAGGLGPAVGALAADEVEEVAGETPAWYDVRTYGAAPAADAATNDAAFAAAVADIPAIGGVLYIPAGTYTVSAPVTVKSNVLIQGDGMNATVLRQSSAAANGITLTGSGPRYVAIRDLKLIGQRSGTGVGIELTTTTTSAVASCDLSRLYLRDFGSHGVSSNTLITSAFADVRVQNCGGDGFHLVSGTSVAMTACYALSCAGAGFGLDQVSYSTLVNCACDASGTGYRITSSGNVSLVACGCERAVGVSYLVDGGTSNGLLNCYSSGNNAIAFRITGNSALATLTGVREVAPGPSATASIQVEAGSLAFVVGPSTVSATAYAANSTNQWTPGALGLTDTRDPATPKSRGGTLYVENGALRYRGSKGTVTTIARA